MPRLTAVVFLVTLLSASAASAAPPTLNYLFPAGAARGKTVTVKAAGVFPRWPIEVWVDRPGLKVEPYKDGKDNGKLNVTVDADAEPGVFHLRLYDGEGGTALRPFYVGTLPEVLEKEPNDQPDAPQKLEASAVINGKLEKRGDVDTYAIDVRQGQTLVASMRANTQLGSPVDAVLQVCSSDGFVLHQYDDEHGLDPQFAFEAPRDGTYLVRTFGFPAVASSSISFAGGEDFVYRLTITTGPFVDHTLPLAAKRDGETEVKLFGWNLPEALQSLTIPAGDGDQFVLHRPQLANTLALPRVAALPVIAGEKNSPAAPQAIELPCVISGRIADERQAHAFEFTASKGQRWAFRVESAALGYPLDALLAVSDATGKTIAEVDDAGAAADPVVTFTAPADGKYTLVLRDLHERGGFRFAYRLVCGPVEPDFTLALAGGEFAITAGKTLEIPVTVNRLNGVKGDIAIAVEGLPDGVSCEAAASAEKGDTAKTVTLKLSAAAGAKPSSASFRVVGRSGETLSRTATFPLANIPDSHHTAAWLTVTGK